MWSSASLKCLQLTDHKMFDMFLLLWSNWLLMSEDNQESRDCFVRLVTVQQTFESEQEEQNKIVDFWSLRVVSAPSHFCYMACFETAVPTMTGWSANNSPHLEAGIEEKCVLSKRKQNGLLGSYYEMKLIRFKCWDESCNMYGSDVWIYKSLIHPLSSGKTAAR